MKRKTMFTCIVLIIAPICNSLYVHGDPKKFEPEQEKLLEMGEATITVIKKDIDYDEMARIDSIRRETRLQAILNTTQRKQGGTI